MRSLRRALAVSALCVALSGCGSAAPGWQPGAAGSPQVSPSPDVEDSLGILSTQAPPANAPSKTFAVGTRTLNLSRSGRSLPTTIWYPATSKNAGAPVAAGRFPVVLVSHGLHGLPAYYRHVTTRFAAAGFVIAAPAYPFTKQGAPAFNSGDMDNQPADASHVITELLKLDGTAGDLFAGHLDGAHIGAAGHSAGGFTTAGLLAGNRDTRIKAGVVIAGGAMGSFTGTPTPVLFVHGDRDPTVPYAIGRSAYDRLTWPKAILTALGQGHGEFLNAGAKGFDQTMRTMLDFLRWALYGDADAKTRLARDGNASGITRYEAKL